MKKLVISLILMVLIISNHVSVTAQTVNESDTHLCDTLKYALINSLRDPIDKAIVEIYKHDKQAPEALTWASYNTEILKIIQVYGVGGLYEITLKVEPYYEAHNTYGVDQVVVNSNGDLLNYEHLKTYPQREIN